MKSSFQQRLWVLFFDKNNCYRLMLVKNYIRKFPFFVLFCFFFNSNSCKVSTELFQWIKPVRLAFKELNFLDSCLSNCVKKKNCVQHTGYTHLHHNTELTVFSIACTLSKAERKHVFEPILIHLRTKCSRRKVKKKNITVRES